MSNIVEFVVKMRDMMSGGLTKLSSSSNTTFSRISKHINDVTGRNKVLDMSFSELQRKIKQTERIITTSTIPSQIKEARQELAKLQRMSLSHKGNISGSSSGASSNMSSVFFGNVAADLAMRGASAIAGAASSIIETAFSGAIKKEQHITGLTTFLGKGGAEEAYKNIQQDASLAPFNVDALYATNRALISAGLSAKEAREDALNLANAVAAVGGKNPELDRMAANLQQIKTVGKATTMDIRQFGMVGINIYEILSRATGKSIKEVKEMDVTYEQLAKALAMARGKGGIYEGALEAQGATMGAKIMQVKDKLQIALTNIGDAFSPVINKVLDFAINIASQVQPMLARAQPYIDAIAGGISQAVDYVMSLSSGTGEWSGWIELAKEQAFMFWGHLKNISSTVLQIVLRVAQWISKSEIIKDVFRIFRGYLDGVLTVVGWIGNKLLWLWDNVLAPILEGIEEGYKLMKMLALSKDNSVSKNDDNNNDKGTPSTTPATPRLPLSDLSRFNNNSLIGSTESAKKNKESGRKTGDTISGGGPRTVNIHLGKFFETIQFTTMNGNESVQELEKIVTECLGRVLFNGAKTV